MLGPTPPSGAHLLGTDDLGRDYLSELLFAGRISLDHRPRRRAARDRPSAPSSVRSRAIVGGWVDELIMRITDLFLIVPGIAVLALALRGTRARRRPRSCWSWPPSAGPTSPASCAPRCCRCARRSSSTPPGSSAPRPRGSCCGTCCPTSPASSPSNISLATAAAIIVESTLSFLGFGVQPPRTSWGNMLSQAAGLVGTDAGLPPVLPRPLHPAHRAVRQLHRRRTARRPRPAGRSSCERAAESAADRRSATCASPSTTDRRARPSRSTASPSTCARARRSGSSGSRARARA